MNTAQHGLEGTLGDDLPLLTDRRLLALGFFAIGIILGSVAIYLITSRPLLGQLGQLQKQMSEMESSLKLLVGERGQAWEAGHLLSDLKSLSTQIEEARATVRNLRDLQTELAEQGRHTAAAGEALTKLTKLQDLALSQEQVTDAASQTLKEMTEIQQRLIDEHTNTPKAHETLADLERVRHDLTELLALKAQIAKNTTDLDTARTTATALVTLKNDLAANTQNLEAARTNAQQIFEMQEELKAHSADLADASTNLEKLVEIKDKLIDQTPAVADALQNLEILNDFREELTEQILALNQMREGLIQIVLMESSINRVAKLLEPLAQISNVRRLSDQEMRNAARTILDSRSPRLGSQRDALPDLHREAAADPFIEANKSSTRLPDDVQRDSTVPAPLELPVQRN
ncbi:MAG: hypothetical protein JSS02_04635 [Planctomycetes bacterium]|nr:hypothetical protein [Planctomycetota bacterium]